MGMEHAAGALCLHATVPWRTFPERETSCCAFFELPTVPYSQLHHCDYKHVAFLVCIPGCHHCAEPLLLEWSGILSRTHCCFDVASSCRESAHELASRHTYCSIKACPSRYCLWGEWV